MANQGFHENLQSIVSEQKATNDQRKGFGADTSWNIFNADEDSTVLQVSS
jgi:hypothetical protein